MDTQSADDTVDIDLGRVPCNGEAIADLELNLACFSEKVANLSNFVRHLDTLGVELEVMVLDTEEKDMDMDCVGMCLEFDLLCGVLGSDVVELDRFLDTLHAEVADARERVAPCNHQRDKLLDSEQYLRQSEEQFSEIKKQYASFQRTLCYKWGGNGNVEEGEIILEDDPSLNVNTVMNMQTTEQQRHVLWMLEKSLANEMDLEKNFNNSRQVEERLKQKIVSLEQELFLMEDEATDAWERWLEADNAHVILTGISKGLLGRLHVSQFNLNGLNQRESELRGKLLNVKASADEYQKQYIVLCSKERDMEDLIAELEKNVSYAKSQANTAEAQCKVLKETNDELRKHAVASAEASQEKQNMLYATIQDMDHVIRDLKLKVSKAESRADSTEEKCIILSKSNTNLNEEVSFLRSRLESLEGSLHQVEEAKMASAKDIRKQTKVFKNLVMQLAVERERLNKQVRSSSWNIISGYKVIKPSRSLVAGIVYWLLDLWSA
ncbi:hypothetical protein Fmac_017332 [Flemingia macrophylla]|uniref:WIT1/2 N-terminal helical bundle domain-containing protein n=1 Tax=Flemingia macrophylla TaxID=520843 RepID=A0ABD1M1Z9_9FABA